MHVKCLISGMQEVIILLPTAIVIIVVQSLSHVQFFVTPWTAAHQASLSFTILQRLLKLTSIESMMSYNHLVLLPSSPPALSLFPASESFPVSRLFASSGRSVGASASASVLPMNIQGWFPLGLNLNEMATHSSSLAWRIPWMEELGGLQSTSLKESDTTERLYFHFHFPLGLTGLIL